mmetsp:Transcript_16648/g.18018  ORF Transcript_16648/g.18018 Transcript_16648/m.18018 type:complete len:622 (-) Transcript_16648:1321-3186(-)
MIDSGYIIAALLVTLCILAALDLWRQFAIKDEAQFELNYSKGITLNPQFWKIGYQLEDIEVRIDSQYERFQKILHNIDMNLAPRFVLNKNTLRNGNSIRNIEYTRKSRIVIHELEQNDTEIFQIRCEEKGPQLRVGLNDYRTDSRDECQLFTSPKVEEHIGPQHMFDLIHLDSGAFALRYVGNGMYVTAVPPPADNSRLPWKLVVGGPSIGAAETFRLTSEKYLYSALMGGFFFCGAGQMITGYSDSYHSNFNHFILESVPKDLIMTSYALVDLSKKVSHIQSSYLQKYETQRKIKLSTSTTSTFTNASSLYLNDHDIPIKIALAIPMTSKGTAMKDVLDSPFWNNLFDSFMKSIDWRSNKYIYRFYIGFDRADGKYDTGDAWNEFREEFKHRAIFRMSEQMMSEEVINSILEGQLSLKLMHFDHLDGAPSQIVSQLIVTAYADTFDYFYQVNDDTVLETPNWATKLIATLKTNPFVANFGVTGPLDSNNEKIFTHSFVHRTHIDVFGYHFPSAFKNWWSDDWISTVYGSKHTFRCSDVTIKHNVHGQKTGDINRYQVDKSAQFVLEDELRFGHAKIDAWLKKHSLPRLPLPEICSYIPTVRYIASRIIDSKMGNEIKESL